MEKLPSELLCIIFSCLDKKSRKSATATCQLWFDVIRNSNLSNHICYKDGDSWDEIVKKLQQKIENLEWDWKRWPALKTFEIQNSLYIHYGCNLNRTTEKKDLLNDLPIDFKKCPTMEMVIFDVRVDFADVFPSCDVPLNRKIHYPNEKGIVLKLAYNPQIDITHFGFEHIWKLRIRKQCDDTFKLINENSKRLKELEVDKVSFLDDLVGLDGILQLSTQNALIGDEDIKIEGLKKLEVLKVSTLDHLEHLVGMNSLLELHIRCGSSSEEKIDGLKKLKLLTLPKLALLDNFVDMDSLLELNVTDVQERELKAYDLSNITQRFKNLQKCGIHVEWCSEGLTQPKAYAEIVENIFQNSATRVKIVFDRLSYSILSKEPFQKCVLKKLCDTCGLRFELRFGTVKPIRYAREGKRDFKCKICDKNQDLLSSIVQPVHEEKKPTNEVKKICCNEEI